MTRGTPGTGLRYLSDVHRVAQALLVALAVIVFGTAGYVLTHGPTIKDAGTTPSAGSVSAPASTPSGKQSGSRAAQGLPVVAFLGDDWTLGQGASSARKGFAPRLGTALDIKPVVVGANLSGYANTGSSGKMYGDLVPQVVKSRPDVVVVTGGRNDQPPYGPAAGSNAKALFARLHKELPQATLIAIAPWWGDSDLPPTMTALGSAVRTAVHAAGGHYIDLPDPIHGHPNDMSSSSDPDDGGYAAIAKALGPKLRPLITRS